MRPAGILPDETLFYEFVRWDTYNELRKYSRYSSLQPVDPESLREMAWEETAEMKQTVSQVRTTNDANDRGEENSKFSDANTSVIICVGRIVAVIRLSQENKILTDCSAEDTKVGIDLKFRVWVPVSANADRTPSSGARRTANSEPRTP